MPDNCENKLPALLAGTVLASSLSEGDGLIPLNPTKWPEFIASSALQSDPRIQPNNVLQAVENLEATFEYLDSAHNVTHSKDRWTKVGFDTAVVNAACEIPGALGTIFAGSYANQMAEQYVQEIIEDEVGKPMETQFSCELRLRGGPGSKKNNNGNFTSSKPSFFGGVGIFVENAEKTDQNILNPRLRRGGRPLWSYKFFGGNGTAFIMGNCDVVVQFPFPAGNHDILIRFPTGKLLKRIFSKGYNSKLLQYSLDLLLIAGYIKYAIAIAMFIKKLIDKHGLKSIRRLLKHTNIKIIVKYYIKSILKKIGEVKNKIRFNFKVSNRKPNWKKWLYKKPSR